MARHPQIAQDMMTGCRSQRSGFLSSVTGAVNRLLEVGVRGKRLQMGCAQRTLEWLSGNHVKAGDGNDTHPPPYTITTGNRWWPHLSLAERALVRSQSGPLASVPFTALPIHRISRMDPELFRVLLLRRLRMPLPPQCSRLPVWPSPRRPWPPPRSVQQSWGVGQKGVRRKCCRSDLQGRRRASVHQRHAAGLGHFSSTQLRRTTSGSGGRKFVFVWRVPACFGCHRRLHASRRWYTQEEG